MADLLVDTGELDLTLGRTPGEGDKYDLNRISNDPEVEPVRYEPLTSWYAEEERSMSDMTLIAVVQQ